MIDQVPASTRPRAWPVLLAAGIGLAILLSLGVWQVKRLAWKQDLIAHLEQAMAAPAAPLAEVVSKPITPYARVRLKGSFASGEHLLVMASANGGPAWTVLRPFTQEDGTTVLVDCGKSPTEQAPPPPAGVVEAQAVLRLHAGRGYFDPDNPSNGKTWYWWDVPAMASRLNATESRFTLSLLPGQPGTENLLVEPPKVELRNNHLGYAITWFGLAATLLVMTAVFLRRRPPA